MKFTCNTIALNEACQNVQRAASSKTTLPSIEGILLKAEGNTLTLTGYDLEVGIVTNIEARVEESGAVIINARVLCDIVRNLPTDVCTISADERQTVKIISGDFENSIMGISAAEYPELPSVSGGFPIVLKGDILKDMIRKTYFAAADNDATKAVHTGVKFEIRQGSIRLVAVDGFRLAIRNEKFDYDGEEKNFVVPKKTLTEVIKLIPDGDVTVSMGVAKRHILFEIENYSIVSRLLDGEFLDYKAAIPSSSTTDVKANLRQLIESVERVSIIIADRNKSPIRCIFDNDLIRVSSSTTLGLSNDKMVAKVIGNKVEIGFNNKFLLDALKVCDSDEVVIKLNGPVQPIIIVPNEGDSFLFLVLPIRLKRD
ncbi:MAG: DNA polymerase III subunit beta [Ruminococcaceae bacterium]|jgi:DNA polymerase-3 subunit beta|nr:DNA polymerase III subunit beta [Oscillospiraceae bacterium]